MKLTEETASLAVNDALAAYHKSEKRPEAERLELSHKVQEARQGLMSALAVGANDCPKDKSAAVGMLKRPAYQDSDGIDQPPVYEVGCPVCPLRSRGNTPKDAVAKWNAKEYVKAR